MQQACVLTYEGLCMVVVVKVSQNGYIESINN